MYPCKPEALHELKLMICRSPRREFVGSYAPGTKDLGPRNKDNSEEQTRTRRTGDKGVGSRRLEGRTRAWDCHAAIVAGCNEAQITHATRPEPSGLQVSSEGRR